MSRRIYRNANGKIVSEAVPLIAPERYVYYHRQTGAVALTPRQRRRLRHKANRADAAAIRRLAT